MNITDKGVILLSTAAIVAALCMSPAAHAQAARESSTFLSRLEQSAELIRDGQLSQAETALVSMLAEKPQNANALNLLGVVRAKQQRAREAEQLFRRALTSSPTHLGAHINLGELFIATNRPKQALPVLLAAHRLAPDRPDINLNLATLYDNIHDYARALEHLRLIPRSDSSAEYFQLMLKSLLKLGRLEEARRLSTEYKEMRKGDADEQARFAISLAEGGMSKEALDLLEDARLRMPESFAILYALGRVARKAGNLEKSLAHLVHARRLAPDSPGVLYEFGATALEMDLLLDALPAFEQLYRLRPREPAYIYALAAARFRKGEVTEAARLMKSYVELRPQDPAGFYLLGASLHILNEYAEARVALERSLKLKADADAEYLLGEVLYKEGDRAAAIEKLRRVVLSRPGHAAAHAALGVAYREQGDTMAARAALERAVELDPKDLRAHYQLGLVYAKLGDKEAAKKMFGRADSLRGEQRNRESVILKLIDPPQN